MAIQFKDCPVILNPEDPPGNRLSKVLVLAKSATVSDNISLTEINNLGTIGATKGRPTDIVNGSINIDFTYGNGTFTVGGEILSSPLSAWINELKGSNQFINGSIGPFEFNKAVFRSFSISCSPNSVIDASLSFDFFNSTFKQNSSGPTITLANISAIGHGGKTSADFSDASIGMNSHPFSFSYTIDQDYEVHRLLGEVTPKLIERINGSISVDMEGDNLGSALTRGANTICQDKITEAEFIIKDLCSASFTDSYKVNGYIQSRNISLSDNDIARGELSIVDYF